MRVQGYIATGLALALASTSVLAFEQQGGGAPPPVPATPAPAEVQAPPSGNDLNFSTPKIDTGDSAGTEVRIPGLGKLGVLPKMDFGLELLYGANDTSKQPEPEQPAEDLTIRGSVKHNF